MYTKYLTYVVAISSICHNGVLAAPAPAAEPPSRVARRTWGRGGGGHFDLASLCGSAPSASGSGASTLLEGNTEGVTQKEYVPAGNEEETGETGETGETEEFETGAGASASSSAGFAGPTGTPESVEKRSAPKPQPFEARLKERSLDAQADEILRTRDLTPRHMGWLQAHPEILAKICAKQGNTQALGKSYMGGQTGQTGNGEEEEVEEETPTSTEEEETTPSETTDGLGASSSSAVSEEVAKMRRNNRRS